MARPKADPNLLSLRLTIHIDREVHGPIYEAIRELSPARAALHVNALFTELMVLRGLVARGGGLQSGFSRLAEGASGVSGTPGAAPDSALVEAEPVTSPAAMFDVRVLAEKYDLEIDNSDD